MIALFKQKSPANLIILLLFGLLIKLPALLNPVEPEATDTDGKLYQWLVGSLPEGAYHALAGAALAFFLLYIQSLMVTYITNEYRMTLRHTYLPGMAYLLITTFLPQWSQLSAALVASTFIIWSFSKLFRLYNIEAANGIIYDIGLITGLASFIYFPSILMAVCLWLGILILRPFRLNEIFLLLVGIATPYYFYAAYLFLTDHLSIAHLFPRIILKLPGTLNSLWLVGATLFLSIPFLIGSYHVQALLRKMLIQARKNWSIILLYALIVLFVPFVNGSYGYQNWVIAAAPFCLFHACTFLYTPRKWFPILLFWLMVLFILTQQILLSFIQGGKHLL